MFSADTGALLEVVEPEDEPCGSFGTEIELNTSRLLVTEVSYCGSGKAFVFRRP